MSIERIQRLKRLQRENHIDYVALVPGPNLIYFAGLHMHLSERPIVALLPADDRPPILIAPFFEVGKATSGRVKLDWQVHSYRDGVPYQQAFDETAAAHGLRDLAVGVEPAQMRVLEWSLLSAAIPGARQISAEAAIAELRMRKDPAEVAAMRRAIQLSEEALSRTLEDLRPGMTERQAAGVLMANLLASGADGLAFAPLVQAGPSGANPHAGAGDGVLHQGQTLIMDFGMTLDDYSSDITRTVAIGGLDDEMKRAYAAVQAANAAGRAAAKPGVACEDVDKAARDVIERAGFGQFFTHRTGHGLGLEGHEAPYIVAGNALVLQPGMTFTVEPGIYIPGKGGVRIEDNVIITESGCESLTTFTRDLLVI